MENQATISGRAIINQKSSKFFLAKIDKAFTSPLFNLISTVAIIIGIISFLAGMFNLEKSFYFLIYNGIALGLLFANIKLFYLFKIQIGNPKVTPNQLIEKIQGGGAIDISPLLDYECALALLKSTNLTPDAFFLTLCQTRPISFILHKSGLSAQSFVNLQTGTALETVLYNSLTEAAQNNQQMIITADIFWGFISSSQILQDFFYKSGLAPEDLKNIVYWEKSLWSKQHAKREIFNPENWVTSGGIAKDWASGYTNNLDGFSKDITEMVTKRWLTFSVVSRENLTEEIETILSKSRSHLIMVGEAGVGRKALILDFARKIAYGQSLPSLAYKRIIELDIGALLAGADLQSGEIETRLKLALNDAVKAGNVILFIDDIHSILTESGRGTVNAAQILIPYLESGRLQLIGATTPEFWHKIGANSTITALFSRLEIPETDENQTLRILQEVSFSFEAKYGVSISYQSLKETYDCANKYIPYQAMPAKAVDLLEEACIHAQNSATKMLTSEIVKKTVSLKTNIPVQSAGQDEKNILLNLESFLHLRVVGQEEAVKAIANALRRARSGLESGKRPIASFLFLGPTGVGKTELSKALAEAYFGDEKNMIRMDMSEYKEISSINKLLGEEGSAGGYLTKPIREKPFSLLLLDEIEKAHPDILNLFLQILDDGRITDNLERTIDFTHAIIIATSNAGSELIRENAAQINDNPKEFKKILLDKLQREGLFRPEFLNRFDGIITFNPLTENQVTKIAALLVKDVSKKLDEKGITLVITDAALSKLAALGYNREFGGRQMRRIIQDKLENFIAKKLLENHVDRGDTITFDAKDIEE